MPRFKAAYQRLAQAQLGRHEAAAAAVGSLIGVVSATALVACLLALCHLFLGQLLP